MKKNSDDKLSVCSLGVSCNEMIDTPMLLVVGLSTWKFQGYCQMLKWQTIATLAPV